MLQRIQSIWLLISAALLVALLFLPFGYLVLADRSMIQLEALTKVALPFESMINTCSKFIGIFSIHAFAFSFISIFFFKNRKRQKRLVYVSIIFKMLIMTFLGVVYFENGITPEVTFQLNWVSLFPIIAVIFDLLAIVGIKKDEALIRSLDRIR